MKFGIFVFPGSNCDHDCYYAVKHILKQEAKFIWHAEPDTSGCDSIIIPGGFSYGDYLRPGAIAKISPAMAEIVKFAKSGGPVIGICNGFQILLEAGLLPGAMLRNASLRFVCTHTYLKVMGMTTPFTSKLQNNQIINIPIAHADGAYYAEPDTIKELENEDRILFKYCSSQGEVSNSVNPNGSMINIAGICNKNGNVLGMMPHPERAVEKSVGGIDGRPVFESMIEYVVNDNYQR